MFSLSRLVRKNWSKTWQENWPRNFPGNSAHQSELNGFGTPVNEVDSTGASENSNGGISGTAVHGMSRGIASYLVAGIVGAVVASVALSACTKVSLLNPDSNSTEVGIAAPVAAPVAPVPMPIAGTAILTGGGISTGTGPSGTVMKVISTIGEPLVIAGTGGESIQKNADMQVIPGLQGTLYQQ